MKLDHLTLSEDAVDEFQRLRLSVGVLAAAQRIWDRILTAAQRKALGGFKKAFRATGPIGVWMKLRGISAERATVDLAFRLDLTNRQTANWLLRQFREPELDAEPGNNRRHPSWNLETRKLTFCGKAARQVPRPNQASNIVCVLHEFEAQGWPPRIDDPLPGIRDTERLHHTVQVLNTGLELIRFHADGTGDGIAWTVI